MNQMPGMNMFMGMSINWGYNISWVFRGWKTNDDIGFLGMLLGFWLLLAVQMVLKHFRNSKSECLGSGIAAKIKNIHFWICIALSFAIYSIQSLSMLLLMSFSGWVILIFLLMASLENMMLTGNKKDVPSYTYMT